MSLQPRPNTLHLTSLPTVEVEIVDSQYDNEYKQVKTLHKGFSDSNNLSAATPREQLPRQMEKSNSSSFILEDYGKRKSVYQQLSQRKEYYSLFCLAPRNPIRRLAIGITEAKAFEYFILLTIIFSCVVMAIDSPLPEGDEDEVNKIANQIEYVLIGIFGLEALLRIVAMGFLLHPHSYLRSVWNILDFIVVIFSIFSLDIIIGSKNKYGIKALRAIRVLRPIKLISGIPSLQVVMMSIVRAMYPLLQVLFLIGLVIVFYAIIGLEFFSDKSHFSCYDYKTKTFDNLPCDNKTAAYFVQGRKCPEGTVCLEGWSGMNDGITTFDNIFFAMLTIFQCITMEGWTDIMYNTFYIWDSSGYIWSVYYVSMVVLGSFFLLNLVLGVLSGEFAKEREKVENRRAFMKLRQEHLLSKICEGYFDWIEKGEEITFMEEVENVDTDIITLTENDGHTESGSSSTHDQRKEKFLNLRIFIKKLQIKVKSIVKHNCFFWFVILMVFINSIIMATRHHRQPAWLDHFQGSAEWFFICVFTLEILIKIFAFGLVGYCRSLFNIFDLVNLILPCIKLIFFIEYMWVGKNVMTLELICIIYSIWVVCLSIIEIILREILKEANYGFSVLRCLRLLRAFKATKYWSALRNLVTSLMNAIKSILSLIFLLFLFIVILALLGMQLFGGKFVKLNEVPRTKFDSIQESLLAVFQVITGEDWNVVMYNGMLVYGGATWEGLLISIYFIFLVIFGNYTLLNVFLAIAVDNLTNAEILTHDEEAAETKRMKNNLQHAFECNQELSQNALSFVSNLKAKAGLSQDELSQERDENKLDMSAVVLQNGNSQGTPDLKRRNNSLSVFDKVLLSVPGSPKQNDMLSTYLSPKKTPERYMMNVQKKWRSIVDYSSDHPELFSQLPNENNNIQENEMTKNEHIETLSDANSGDHINGEGNDGEDDFSEEEDIEQEIKDRGMLNVLKFNVTNRRRIIKKEAIVQHNALFIFSPTNRFRKVCHAIVHFRYFDWCIMTVIVMSSITLGVEDPVHDDSYRNQVLGYFDYFFTTVFGLEVLLKVIDRGLVLHKRAYLRNFWNVLDAFVFLCNLTSIILTKTTVPGSNSAKQFISTLRVLRVLRPLKAIQRVKKLKAVVQCVVYSLKNVAFVLIIFLLILFIFACIGVQLFHGKFNYCTDPSKMTEEECQGYYFEFKTAASVLVNQPKVKERNWKRREFHFDNIFDAMLTLYTSSTGEGWPNSMQNTMDATELNHGPSINNKQHMSIYYFVFVVIFSFMIINIYIALIILTFQRQGEKEIEGSLDRNQRDCLSFVLNSKPRQRYMPSDKKSLSYRLWYIVDSTPFDYFIMVLIVLNTIQLTLTYYKSPESLDMVLTALNIAFTVLFCIEAILKIIAYRLVFLVACDGEKPLYVYYYYRLQKKNFDTSNYFKDLWNVFDFLVIIGSIGDIILTMSKNKIDNFIDPSMFRLCRIARIIKLLRKGENIRLLLWTFLKSFKALPYVTFLLMLLFYIYAIIGMQLFGKIKPGSSIKDSVIHEYNNFQSIIQAMQVLFRSSTGEGWNSIMYACYDNAECVDGAKGCGSKFMSSVYFCSFIFLCMFLLLNLFVAVIMDNFEYLTRDASILGPHHLDEFVRFWSEYDPQAIGYIHHELVYKLLCQLSPPIGFGKQCPKEIAYKRLIQMNMPILKDGKSVSFYTTLLALIRNNLSILVEGNVFDNDKELRKVMHSLWPKASEKNLHKVLPKPKGERQLTIGKIYCVKLIVMKFRKARGNVKEEIKKESSPSVLKRLNSLFPSLRRHLSTRSHNLQVEKQEKENDHKTIRRLHTFGGRVRRSQNDHHTKEGQLRRRSSWSDIPSFLRFGNKETSASTSNLPSKDDAPDNKSFDSTSQSTNQKVVQSSPSRKANRTNGSKTQVSRASSLRMYSTGGGITHHRKTSNTSLHSLQYDHLNKQGMLYHSKSSLKGCNQRAHPNSAPTTPRSLSNVSPMLNGNDFRNYHSNQNSPLTTRNSSQVQHRRSHSNPGSNMFDQLAIKENQNYRNNILNDLRYENQGFNDARTINRNNFRRDITPHENNIDDYNKIYSQYDTNEYDNRSPKSLQESTSLPSQNDANKGSNSDYQYARKSETRMKNYDNRQRFHQSNNIYREPQYENDVKNITQPLPAQNYLQTNSYKPSGSMTQSNTRSRDNIALNSQIEPGRGQQNQQQIGHFSHKQGHSNSDMVNGTSSSQQYYDNMISQINDQIAKVEGGPSPQPFNTRVQKTVAALPDDDDNEWC